MPPPQTSAASFRLSPLDWLAARDARLIDVVVTLSALGLTLLAVLRDPSTGLVHSPGLSALLAAAACLTLLARRRLPELVTAATLLATLMTDDTTPLIFGTWALARYGGRHRWSVLGAAALCYLGTRPVIGADALTVKAVYHLFIDLLLPAGVGAALRRQEELHRLALAQVERVRAGVRQAAEYAVVEERTRLAFDMHDGIGHRMAVLTLQAEAVRTHADEPGKVRDHATALHRTARELMAELREILGVLRTAPGAERLPMALERSGYLSFQRSLVRNLAAVGVPVTSEVAGTPVPLPPQIQLILYRIGQEGLTNAVKYAPGSPIHIRLSFSPRQVSIALENGRPTQSAPPLGSSGVGLGSLAARVRGIGGTLHAAPTPSGGFLLRARLPVPPEGAGANGP